VGRHDVANNVEQHEEQRKNASACDEVAAAHGVAHDACKNEELVHGSGHDEQCGREVG
jgi:hypothetical protein